jgi:hypothetical protein
VTQPEDPAFSASDGLRHHRHYTLEQAMAVRGWVAERVRWVRAAQARLMEISRFVGELEAVEIVLRDVDRGLIDFPAMRDGVEVYLCWLVDDEESIGFWHAPEAGFAGRRPL